MPATVRWESEGPGHWLMAGFRDGLHRALEAMAGPEALAGVSFEIRIPKLADWSGWESPGWCRLDLPLVPGAAVATGCPLASAQALGRLMAGCDLPEADCRSSFQELMSQAAVAAGDLITERLEKRAQFSAPQQSPAPAALDYAVEIGFSISGEAYSLGLAANVELMNALEQPAAAAAAASATPSTAASPPAGAAQPANLGILLDLELPVCVTFGRTQLPLKDVVKLASGSIVELNRLANEPVEVLINDFVIARGEVVVVDGNYGVRVTEIVSRQERIRSIF